MINKPFKLRACAFSVGLSLSSIVAASPWVDTQDEYLRASITALSNAGLITTPVNTYPLMYKSIVADVKKAHNGEVPEHLKYALKHLKHSIKYAKQSKTTGIRLKLGSDNDELQSFGQRSDAKAELNLFNEAIGDNWAVKTSIHFKHDSQNGKSRDYENSYLATMLGNWVVSLDQLSQWWGPGNDTTLALSNNAVAFPAVRFTRHLSEPIDLPLLNWLGPISMTTYFGMQEHSNRLQNIRLWGARLNFRPWQSLELGFSRTAQWGGTGRPKGFSTFVDLLAGRDNAGTGAEVSVEQEPGNQLAGIDFHFSSSLFQQPIGIYAEIIGEDESGGLPSHVMYQLGAETSFGDKFGLYHLFAEYTDTFVDCNDDPATGNCAYEHHIYQDGYRRYGRPMGSSYDSDANVLTLGLRHTGVGGYSWQGKLKWMQLNKDNQNNWTTVNPTSPVAQDRLQLEGGYRFPLAKGLFNVAARVYHNKVVATGESDVKGSLKASWEYRF